jgi:hypothetical protein
VRALHVSREESEVGGDDVTLHVPATMSILRERSEFASDLFAR